MNPDDVENAQYISELRDYFAAQALPAVIARAGADFSSSHFAVEAEMQTKVARRCYALADAMMKARKA